MTFDRDELEAAFRTYWQLGAVGEDWDAWCDTCFTEDVTYVEHVLGNKQGRAAPSNTPNHPAREDMPEAPQMQALAERLGVWLAGATFEGYDPLGFTGLKTVDPPPEALVGASIVRVDRRAKYVTIHFDNDL